MIDQTWANAAIERCLKSGVDHFFLAPGSRCTPLTLAVARQRHAQVIQHFDERGLAFAALGYGRATGRPGVFICTSGTAVANAYPAVIEAAMECVPLLLFTADRPVELRGTGANQTIDQREIFGGYAKHFFDMPAPEEADSVEGSSAWLHFDQVLNQGLAETNGPVHFNWMFREPFTIADAPVESTTSSVQIGASNQSMDVDRSSGVRVSGNTVIALGGCYPDEANEALKLAKTLNCPILSDITSGLRTGSLDLPVDFSLPQPDTVLHLGGRIVSKKWHQWTRNAFKQNESIEFFHLTSKERTINPNRLPLKQILTSLEKVSSTVSGSRTSDAFRDAWQDAAASREQVIGKYLAETSSFSEPAIAYQLRNCCPDTDGLFLGNSTPIRDMDWYTSAKTEKARHIAANRGASGIDGLLATAVGYATGLRRPTTVLLGDLSALHDLNSLALIAKSKWPMVVVIINNQAGHIFDLLPVHQSQHFEKFFATPHPFQFEHAARMFGIEYQKITGLTDFTTAYQNVVANSPQTMILELLTDRSVNLRVRHQIQEEIRKCSNEN